MQASQTYLNLYKRVFEWRSICQVRKQFGMPISGL